MELSNKALAVLLLAAMVVSLGGTFLSLNRMNEVEYVGFATQDTGKVNLSIEETVSITTIDGNLVNFGVCVTNNNDLTLSSLVPSPNCTGYNHTDNITNISVRNDGNVDINVTIKADAVGEALGGNFIRDPTDSSWVAFMSTNASRGIYEGGCNGGTVDEFMNFSVADEEYLICSNLTFGSQNSLVTNYELFVPAATETGLNELTVTFTASKRV